MLVLAVDRLGRRQAKAIQAMPSEQRFALTVFAAFAVALVLLAVLFTFSAEPSPSVGGRQVTNVMAHDSPDGPAPAPADPAGANA